MTVSISRRPERRQQRSSMLGSALRYQLEHTRQRGNIRALALTDESGLLIASAGEDAVCEELGAVAPLWRADGLPLGCLPRTLMGQDIAIRAIASPGRRLFLAALGGGAARDALLRHSLTGVERILSMN